MFAEASTKKNWSCCSNPCSDARDTEEVKQAPVCMLPALHSSFACLPGLESGMRVEVYASTEEEVEQVRKSKDLPGLASFEQELKQTMRRQRGSSRGRLTLPSGLCSSGVYTHMLIDLMCQMSQKGCYNL